MNRMILHRAVMLISILLASSGLKAQTLEEVSFSVSGLDISTYLTDINDSGFVTGYYDSAGLTVAFVVNPEGKIIRNFPTSGTVIKAEGINNNGTVLFTQVVGGNTAAYRAPYDSVQQLYPTLNTITGINNPNLFALGINNNDDFVGYFGTGLNRFLWVKNDGVSQSYTSDIYTVGQPPNATAYATYAGGINDNGKVCAFYINGNVYTPLLWDHATSTFAVIGGVTALNRMKTWDINNSNTIVGEYFNNGVWTAFWSQVSGNSFVAHNSLSSIFHDNSIQSVANGINNKGEIIGSYLHPTTNKWVGFIYRPNQQDYRLPGFDWQKHTWNMRNLHVPTYAPPVWSSNYWGTLDYVNSDPYHFAGLPLFDPFIMAEYPGLTANMNQGCVDWKSFAQEYDMQHMAAATPNEYYTWRWNAFNIWYNEFFSPSFDGVCSGFSYTSLLKYSGYDTTLNNWFGIPATTDLHTVANTDQAAIRGIVRTYLKQYDKPIYEKYINAMNSNAISTWCGLYRLKNTCMEADPMKRNPRGLSIEFASGSLHSIVPYKVKTPKKFPFSYNGFTEADTLFVYDSNYPSDSSLYLAITSNKISYPNTAMSFYAYDTSQNPTVEVIFNEMSVKDIAHNQFSDLSKTTTAGDDSVLTLALQRQNHYDIEGSGSTHAVRNQTGFTSNIPYLLPVQMKDRSVPTPSTFRMDTSRSVTVTTSNYELMNMAWNMRNNFRAMGISRLANQTEKDHGTWKNYYMSYGNPDNVAKELNCYLIESSSDYSQGVNILMQGVTMNQNDSIHTENPSQFVYKITRITGSTDSYNLWIKVTGPDSIRDFKANNIPLGPNTSHTVIPYFDGPTGKQVVVQVDNGNDGSVDDTIMLANVTGINQIFRNSEDVKVYPSPFDERITVELATKEIRQYHVSVSDITGKNMYRQSFNQKRLNIPTQQWALGLYMITVLDDAGQMIYIEKLIKE